MNLTIKRVTALPGTLDASCMYIVQSADAGLAEIVFTNNDGLSSRHVINKTEIASMISTAVSNFSNILMVADITARDAMTLDHNALVLVLDASADATVVSGAAMYFYDLDTTTWYKVSEFESMDVTITWDSIQGKPTSSVADIDDAVAKKHAHVNMTQLDKIGEDGNGELTYNGSGINAALAANEW